MPAVVGAMSPDIEWNEAENFPYADGNRYRGPDAIRVGVLARIGGEWDGFAAEPREFVDRGDTVVMTGRYTGTYEATGLPINAQVAHFWTLEGGKVVQFQQLVDTLAVARGVGVVD